MKTCYLLLVLVILTGCRSFPLTSLAPTPQTLSTRLPALEKEYARPGNFAPSESVPFGYYPVEPVPPEIQTVFEREIDDRITQPLGARYGSVALKVNFVQNRMNWFWPILSTGTLFIGNALGMPYTRWRSTLEVEVHVFNANHELLGRYRGTGQSRVWSAAYWGYDLPGGYRLAYVEAFRKAMDQIKTQMDRDAGRLRAELIGTGPLH